MGRRVRAKVHVDSVKKYAGGAGMEEVQMTPVYRGNPEGENTQFWNATPSGEIRLDITNPEAQGFFEPGDEFYVDFEKVEADEEE